MPGNHLARIYDRLGVETRAAAARIALTVPQAVHRPGAARWPSSCSSPGYGSDRGRAGPGRGTPVRGPATVLCCGV